MTDDKLLQPPKDNLVRAVYPGVELRATTEDPTAPPTLEGHFAVFNDWTEIDSHWEGRFMERIAPGAFKKAFSESRDRLQVLFQHGQDPEIGDKPIADVIELEEDDRGARYRATLFDGLPPLVMAGLKAGKYGSSFRFSVVKENLDKHPDRGPHNPDGLPERTVQEARLFEFGPVTFPAYAGATAGVRSLTDAYTRRQLGRSEPTALPSTEPVETTPTEGSRKAYPSITRAKFLEILNG
jgi:HK97 family phage prohead protease